VSYDDSDRMIRITGSPKSIDLSVGADSDNERQLSKPSRPSVTPSHSLSGG